MNELNLMWRTIDGTSFSRAINSAYYQAIHWIHNLFQVPWGKAGTSFVTELASVFCSYRESSALESVALRAAMVMPIVLLQKPHARSKAKDHLKCLEDDWLSGKPETLNYCSTKAAQYKAGLDHPTPTAVQMRIISQNNS